MLLELAKELGIEPKKTSATQGGEYHSPCPSCGGKDRFFIQPLRKMKNCIGYYQCRQCEQRGDAIQFCRDFLGLTYPEACAKIGQEPRKDPFYSYYRPHTLFTAVETNMPSEKWQNRALDFVISSHECAMKTTLAVETIKKRGITLNAIKKYQLGWNAFNRKDASILWDVRSSKNEVPKDVWLPQGIVIPTFVDGKIMKLKIRRKNIPPTGNRSRYVAVSGGRNSPSFFGDTSHKPVIVMESELDAIFIQQFTEDLCCCMAIPAGNKPDIWADRILRGAPQLIFSMDFDEAGQKTFQFWKSAYPHIKAWPSPREKSIGDAFTDDGDLRKWLMAGLNQ